MLPLPYRIAHFYDEEDSDQDVLKWLFQASLLTSLVPEQGVGAPSFTRATTKTFVDYEGRVRTALAGEACFTGARRVRNLCVEPTEGNPTTATAGGTSPPTVTRNVTQLGQTCVSIAFPSGVAARADSSVALNSFTFAATDVLVQSLSVALSRPLTGGEALHIRLDGSRGVPACDINLNAALCPTAFTRLASSANAPTTGGTDNFWIEPTAALTAPLTVYVTKVMVESVTGNSNQTASEYVPVGAPKRNEFINTEAMTGNWTVTNSTLTATNGPEGYANAAIVSNNAVGAGAFHYTLQNITTSPGQYTIAVVAKKVLGSGWLWLLAEQAADAFAFFDLGNGVTGTATGFDSTSITSLGNGWYLCTATLTQTTAAGAQQIGYGVTTGDNVKSWDSTAAANTQQVALAYPRFARGSSNVYFPVGNAYSYPVVMRDGSLSACFADGVAYARYLNGNTVTGSVVTEATGAPIGLWKNASAYQPGLTGSGFSTPSSTASNVAGDIDIRIDAALTSWANGSAQYLASKDDTGTQRSWNWFLDGGGVPNFFVSFDGTVGNSATYVATAAPGFGAGTRHSLRVTRSATTGNVTFYKSDDGQSWTPVGAVVAGAAGNIFASLSQTDVGARAATVLSGPLLGTIYRAQICNVIGGSAVVDFNPNDYTSGATWASSTTGETTTKNGSASILNFPLTGYDEWQASTNLAFPSTDWNTSLGAGYTRTPDFAAAPDGTTSAMRLQWAGSANSFCYANVITATAAQVYTASLYVKANSGTPKVAVRLGANDGSSGVTAEFDFSTGTIGAPVATSGTNVVSSTASKATSLANGWWRIQVSGANSTAITNLTSGVIAATNAAGDALVWGLVMEAGAFTTPYIPTTTVAVTRNADVLTHPGAGNIGSVGACYAEFMLQGAIGTGRWLQLDDGTESQRIAFFPTGSVDSMIVTDATVNQAVIQPGNTSVVGALVKFAGRYAPNNFQAARNGTLGTPDVAGTVPVVNTIRIGNAVGGTAALNGNIRNVRLSGNALADSVLQSLTA